MSRVLVVALTALTVGACQHSPSVSTNEKTLAEYIREAGYTDLAFPSTGYTPGTLVTYEAKSTRDQKLRLRYLCSPADMKIPEPTANVGESVTVSAALGGELKFQGPQLSAFGLGAAASHVDSVSLRLRNVQALEQPLDRMLEIRNQPLGPNCTTILKKFLNKNLAYQTAKALRADVEYDIKFKNDASVSAKGEVIEKLSALFSASGSASGGTSSQGVGLIYGLTLEQIES